MEDDPDKDFVLSLLLDKEFHIEPIPEANYKLFYALRDSLDYSYTIFHSIDLLARSLSFQY